jgi:hypothetical protein
MSSGCDDVNEATRELVLLNPALQRMLGLKFCTEDELPVLLFAQGLCKRVRTVSVEVRPFAGKPFHITLAESKSTGADLKTDIARAHGLAENLLELYNSMGSPANDAPVPLIATQRIAHCSKVLLQVTENPLLWRTCSADIAISQEAAVATKTTVDDFDYDLVTSGHELTKGRHYWEVEVMGDLDGLFIGICRPHLSPKGRYFDSECTDGWFISISSGAVWGNGKHGGDHASPYQQGARVGVLLDLDDGSLLFFKAGQKNGTGYPPGSVTGPVVHAMQAWDGDGSQGGRLCPDPQEPTA